MRRVVLLVATLLLLSAPALAQGTVMPLPVVQFTDSNGVPLSGGLLYTCTQGGSCPGSTQTTYSDAAITTPNANPVVLDTAGRAHVFLSATTYKFVLQTSAGVTVWTQDNVTALAGVSLTTLTGATISFKTPTVLTVSANAVTPTQNIHGLDTSGGAQNLSTINTSSVSAGLVLYLYGNNPASNPVTITSTGNVVLANGTFTLGATNAWIELVLRGSSWYELGRSGWTVAVPFVDDFRISLTTATCATVGDVTAATTVYLTPCTGNRITLFDTSGNQETCTTAEISIAVPATTSTMYDVWAYDSTFGTCAVTLEVLAWTNDTTRATAIARSSGRWTKSGNTTRLYVGNFRTTTVSGQTEDSDAKRYVWNAYNRLPRKLKKFETTASWAYTTATWRCANNSGTCTNQLDFIIGLDEQVVDATVAVTAGNGTGVYPYLAIGLDSTSTPSADSDVALGSFINGSNTGVRAHYVGRPGIGRHVLVWLEYSTAAGTTTWYGNNGLGANNASGLLGWIEG